MGQVTCHVHVCAHGCALDADQAPSGEVWWVECVSIVVQCNAMCSRVSGLVCVWARTHVPQFTFMRKKEASRCKVCAPVNGCMLVRVHGVQCVPSSYVRTVVVKCRSKK